MDKHSLTMSIGRGNVGMDAPNGSTARVEGWILGVPGSIRPGKGCDGSAAPNACDPGSLRLRALNDMKKHRVPRPPPIPPATRRGPRPFPAKMRWLGD